MFVAITCHYDAPGACVPVDCCFECIPKTRRQNGNFLLSFFFSLFFFPLVCLPLCFYSLFFPLFFYRLFFPLVFPLFFPAFFSLFLFLGCVCPAVHCCPGKLSDAELNALPKSALLWKNQVSMCTAFDGCLQHF